MTEERTMTSAIVMPAEWWDANHVAIGDNINSITRDRILRQVAGKVWLTIDDTSGDLFPRNELRLQIDGPAEVVRAVTTLIMNRIHETDDA